MKKQFSVIFFFFSCFCPDLRGGEPECRAGIWEVMAALRGSRKSCYHHHHHQHIIIACVCTQVYAEVRVCAGWRKTLGVFFKDTISPLWDGTLLSSLELITFETGWPVEPQTLPVSVSPELALQARASMTGIFYMGYGYQTRVLLLVKVSSLPS